MLICDSDELFRCNVRNLLESEGFIVEGVFRPSEAAKHVRKQRFVAVIFDLRSDDLICVQIFSAIKIMDNRLPVIIVTDNNEPLSFLSSVIHESFKLFQKPIEYTHCKVVLGISGPEFA